MKVRDAIARAFGNRSLRAKLNTIAFANVAIVLVLLVVAIAASGFNNGLRAYVHGEGLWSKAQKDAIYYLTRYAERRDPADYQKYLSAIAVPLGDRVARLEMLKPVFDRDVAYRGLIAGGNDPDDTPYMIALFRNFRNFGHMAIAIGIWTEADGEIARLVEIADEIHAAIASGSLTAAREAELLDQLEQVNARLTPLERKFSETLGEAARVMRGRVLNGVLLLALSLLGLGLIISGTISRRLRTRIVALRDATARVAAGDLSHQLPVQARDEIGDLTTAFNELVAQRRQDEQQLAQHRELEALITRLSTGMISLTQEQAEAGINQALTEIGSFAQVDRSYIFMFDEQREHVSCTHEWCEEGIAPQIQRLQNLGVADFPWVEASLQRGDVVHVPDMSQLPPEAANERAEWEAESIQSLLLVPVSLGGRVIGYVGFDSVHAAKTWSPEVIALLKIFGEMVGNVLERTKAEYRIQFMAQRDALTELPNRTLLMERLGLALERSRKRGTKVGVLMLDLDHFKNVNDSLGHPAGDQMLRTVAARLSHCVRKDDTVARMGGDEFLIVLTDISGRETIERVAQGAMQAIAAPIVVDDHELITTLSIGACVFPDDAETATDLIKNADTAMYQAKARGRNNYQWFNPAMLLAADERLELDSALRRALERDEFVLHYQPLVSIESGEPLGMEALLRWNHPRRGTVPPGDFTVLAEETGLILPIGQWVLSRACHEGRRLQEQTGRPLIVSVNISARQFRQENLVEVVSAALADSKLPPATLVLEITESVLAANAKETAAVLTRIRELGVRVAVDDFGTGYSSLSYITRFPIDYLKVDRSFVNNIVSDRSAAAITGAIIAMAHSLGIEVVAEGVETPEQLAFLRERHCEKAQGYLFAQPVPAGEFVRVVEKLSWARAKGAAQRDSRVALAT